MDNTFAYKITGKQGGLNKTAVKNRWNLMNNAPHYLKKVGGGELPPTTGCL
jgi:hypothetical protein